MILDPVDIFETSKSALEEAALAQGIVNSGEYR